ncbi:hypothetical protein [Campylobacter phage CJLB-12]|nr:hypothetical protein [Campylobacter phage CJLB-12]
MASPILQAGFELTITVPEPVTMLPPCGGDGLGLGCGIIGSPCLTVLIELVKTFVEPLEIVLGGNEECPVLKSTPTLVKGGII